MDRVVRRKYFCSLNLDFILKLKIYKCLQIGGVGLIADQHYYYGNGSLYHIMAVCEDMLDVVFPLLR